MESMMLATTKSPCNQDIPESSKENSTERIFIRANTIPGTLDEIRNKHVIPVFVKDNEPLISQADFIETAMGAVSQCYYGDQILKPSIRLSHPIKGRVPDARDKPPAELHDWEKTIYYERMMFAIEIPSIAVEINGNLITLTIGGVKSYNQDNLYNKKGADEHFKVFAGFQNKACTNLCVWSDGFASDIRVKNRGQLQSAISNLLTSYNPVDHAIQMSTLAEHSITEEQFAHLIGRCRMYQYLPMKIKEDIEPLLFGDQQIASVCRDYYSDSSFCRNKDGSINLWKLYNLFTGANKSTYIDQFLERSVSASNLVIEICHALTHRTTSWFLT